MHLTQLAGHRLGPRTRTFTADDAILYALAVGASATELDLVYEQDLRVLPTYACALGLWTVEAAGELGAYDRTRSLHVGQTLTIKQALEPGPVAMEGRIGRVYDKGKITVVEITVASDWFDAAYTILLPGVGGWGGEAPPRSVRPPSLTPTWYTTESVDSTAAALYRLTGDKHPVHILASTAQEMGLDGPILHGLATMAIAARSSAAAVGAHPADLMGADVRLSAPVYPDSTLELAAEPSHRGLRVETTVEDTVVLSGDFHYGATRADRMG